MRYKPGRHDEDDDAHATRATARLPGLDIDIVHRPAVQGGAEEISIHMRAAPSFEAFGRSLEAANPFAFWIEAAQLAWMPWLRAARVMGFPWALPWALALPRPSRNNDTSRPAEERGEAE
jgi:hypothetical protein